LFRHLLRRQVVQRLAETYPTPRKKEEVPVWIYLASELSLKLHGAQAYHALPRSLHCYMFKSLCAATIFLSRFAFEFSFTLQLIDLLEAGLRRSQDCDNYGPGFGRHVVTVGVGDLVENPMGPQHADLPADGR